VLSSAGVVVSQGLALAAVAAKSSPSLLVVEEKSDPSLLVVGESPSPTTISARARLAPLVSPSVSPLVHFPELSVTSSQSSSLIESYAWDQMECFLRHLLVAWKCVGRVLDDKLNEAAASLA